MTVREIMQKLKSFDPDMEIVIPGHNHNLSIVEKTYNKFSGTISDDPSIFDDEVRVIYIKSEGKTKRVNTASRDNLH